MKKFLTTTKKYISFFLLWILIVLIGTIIPIIKNPAVNRLIAEIIPLFATIVSTFVFVRILDKNKYKIYFSHHIIEDTIIGIIVGMLWILLVVLILWGGKWLTIGKTVAVDGLLIYCFALLLNTIMQEYLVRGYLFTMLENQYNKVVAVIFTTLLFVALHGGAFDAGLVGVLNVTTMSIFVTMLMLYTDGLVAPIMAHFVWNFVGGIVIDGISLPFVHIIEVQTRGNKLLSGGEYGLENSVITLGVNVALIFFFFVLIQRKKKLSVNAISFKK